MDEFVMPSLGADMDAGTVIEWLVKPGDRVNHGDIVAVVDTDKADVDVEIFQDGVIDRILVPVGEKVLVGTPLATLTGTTQPAREPVPPPEPAPPPEPTPPPEPLPPSFSAREHAVSASERPLSPILRRLAKHLAVDLESVRGSGPRGTITRADIEAAARARGAKPGPDADATRAEGHTSAMREAIARLMTRSKREIPHYYLGSHVDLSRARAWLEDTNGARPATERLLSTVLLIKAVALATHKFPGLNGIWADDRSQPSAAVHVGIAISLRGGGLIAPAIHDADQKSVDELQRDLHDLVARTRAGRLRSSEMSDSTITITNLGDQGVETVYGVIYPPQVALVGFGKITDRPWAQDGMIGIRPVISMTLAADHRASDGHTGARFLTSIDHLLQDPGSL